MSVNSQLTPLLPSARYLLVYTIPLLLTSVLLTFAGTFLTLDRTRTFPPADKSYASLSAPGGLTLDKKKRKLTWILEGGLGGIAGGFAFGIHLSTALSLMIPATTSASHLSPRSFLAIWVLICVITTPLAARYRYAAYTFLGISGGTLFALAFCIIAHPSLPSRITITAIFLPLFTISLLLVAILPISRLTNFLLHPFLRICTAATGAFGVFISVALLMDPQQEGWANAWERLWMANGPVGPGGQILWGSSQEQGLSAGYAVFFVLGIAVDWALRRWIGECPDEKWDKYLANYAANLPNDSNRAGSFQPYKSFLDKFFPSDLPKSEKDILFPSEVDMRTRGQTPLPVTMYNPAHRGTSLPAGVELLKKKRSKKARRTNTTGTDRKGRKPVKFGDLTESSEDEGTSKLGPLSSFSGSSISEQKALKPGYKRGHTSSWSTPTLVEQFIKKEHDGKRREPSQDSNAPRMNVNIDYEAEIAQLKEQLKRRTSLAPPAATATATVAGVNEIDLEDDHVLDHVEYSDYEDDHRAALLRRSSTQDHRTKRESWAPGIPTRLGERHAGEGVGAGMAVGTGTGGLPLPIQQPAPVPATPSLIYALDRLAAAHREAYSARVAPASSPLRPQRVASPIASEGRVGWAMANDDDEDVDVEIGAERRSPRWEEFWREVQVKAQA